MGEGMERSGEEGELRLKRRREDKKEVEGAMEGGGEGVYGFEEGNDRIKRGGGGGHSVSLMLKNLLQQHFRCSSMPYKCETRNGS